MKLRILIVPMLFGCAALAARATPLPSRVTEATVYPDRARVTRAAEVRLKAGENVIEMIGLPLALDENSVRVAGKGLEGVQVESIEYEFRVETDPAIALAGL